MEFTSGRKYKYRKNKIYLGVTPFLRRPIGIKTEKHAITFAAPRSGKGAGLIIPNMFRWPHNALIIDPKGEAAEATAEYREKKYGHKIHVLDPLGVANVPDRFRARLNILDHITPDSPRGFEDIRTIADGLIMRHDPKGGHWDNGGQAYLAGAIAHIISTMPPERRNLIEVRKAIRLMGGDLNSFIDAMAENNAFGGLPMTGAGRLLNSGSESSHFMSIATTNTEWLDSPSFEKTLSGSTFSLSDLKHKKTTVYLVLPTELLGEYGRFLRLFVQSALNAMAMGGTKGRECLFMLDEFYSLGYIEKLSKDASAMPGYGLKIWPILHDIGQLQKLYTPIGAETFFSSSDVQTFFGNTDQLTLEYISKMIGQRYESGTFEINKEFVGKPLMSPREIRAHVAKREKDIVARRMIAFLQGDDVLSIRLKPYFKDWKFK
ncbi:MAG: type IV secretory system conjugative DNA transfer family protein [Flavobacteriaceae bacterium]|nr:type IV secretory system conjugative DNA transfer family protein [Flavobacteriaceae bacterium]